MQKGKSLSQENNLNETEDEIGEREGNIKKYKRLTLAVVVGVLVVGSMSSVAKSGYRYTDYPKQRKGSSLVRYNSNIEFEQDKLDEAYDLITQKLDIPVLKLDYTPKELVFVDVEITKGHAILRFDYKGKSVLFKGGFKSFQKRRSNVYFRVR